jgi:hypothetical protein
VSRAALETSPEEREDDPGELSAAFSGITEFVAGEPDGAGSVIEIDDNRSGGDIEEPPIKNPELAAWQTSLILNKPRALP